MQYRRLLKVLRKQYRHIRDLDEEKERYELEQQHDGKMVQKYTRTYKPSYEIEFNRVGEVLLYSSTPMKHKEVYFKYPYIFFESLIPLCLLGFFYHPFEISYYANESLLLLPMFLCAPRLWYLENFKNYVRRLWLLRGGKVLKVERSSLAGDQYTHWMEVKDLHPLTKDYKQFDNRDESEFLNEEGQLRYDLAIQVDHLRLAGVTEQDKNLFFIEQGVVHEPELFEATIKGYHVDTSDFTINTAHDERVREGHFNI